MNGETTGRRIPRAVIYRRTYGYHAEPGHLVVDVAQGDPPEALISNRATKSLSVEFPGRTKPREVHLVPVGVRFPEERSLRERCQRMQGSVYDLPPGGSLLLTLDRGWGVVPYRATVDGAEIEVSGGSGPDIIIDP